MVSNKLIRKIETQHYEIELLDNGLKVKRLFNAKEKFTRLLLFLPSVVLILLSLICFLSNGYVYAIIFLLVGLLWLVVSINDITRIKLEKEKFYFLIDEKGVCNRVVNGCSFIPWSEVNSFGFANRIYYTRSSFQMCLYFSNVIFEESDLRKRLYHNDMIINNGCQRETIVALEFIERSIDQSVIDTINSYIAMYCDKKKENSYIFDDPVVIFPID